MSRRRLKNSTALPPAAGAPAVAMVPFTAQQAANAAALADLAARAAAATPGNPLDMVAQIAAVAAELQGRLKAAFPDPAAG